MLWMYQCADVRHDDWRLIDFKPVLCKGLIATPTVETYDREGQSFHSDQSTLNHDPEEKTIVHCQGLLSDDDYRSWLEEVKLSSVFTIPCPPSTPLLTYMTMIRRLMMAESISSWVLGHRTLMNIPSAGKFSLIFEARSHSTALSSE